MIRAVAPRRTPAIDAGGDDAHQSREEPVPRLRQPGTWFRPQYWGISARSAFVSATVVLVAFVVAGAGLAFLLYRSLLAGVDDAAAARVGDVVAALRYDTPTELDAALLDTDQRVVAVQVIDSSGNVVARSASAPELPLIAPSTIGTSVRIGLPDEASPDGDMRISGQTVASRGGTYTILVGAGSEAVEATVVTVIVLLSGAAPIVMVVAGAVTYLLVSRSLRSVDAIRARVADISTSDLAERAAIESAQIDHIEMHLRPSRAAGSVPLRCPCAAATCALLARRMP